MIIALISMLAVWGAAALLKKHFLKRLGTIVSLGVGFLLAVVGASFQVFVSASISESSGFEADAMGIIRNAFLTLCIAWYAAFQSLKK